MAKSSTKEREQYIQKLESSIAELTGRLQKAVENEQKLNTIITYSTNLFYAHTPDHQITYVSPQSTDILGYTPEETLVNWTTLNSDNPINEEGFRITCNAIETGVSQPPYELELIHKTGKKVWVEVRETPVVVDGETVEIVGTLTDITQKKKAEDSIRYHLALETAMANASKLFITPHEVDIDKVLETIGKAVRADRAYIFEFSENIQSLSNTFEWCAEGIEPQIGNLQDIPSEGIPWWTRKLKNHENIIIEDVDLLPAEASREKADLKAQDIKALAVVPVILSNDMLWGFMGFDDTKTTRRWHDTEIGILNVISDMISRYIVREKNEKERKKLEKQLFQSQKMESIGRLAGGIAHDFNNTLTGIMGYAELLKIRHKNQDSFEGEAAEIILEGTKRAANLTKQLLGFARGGKYVPTPINLNTLIIDTNLLTEKSISKNIQVVFNLDEDIRLVTADKSQMEQVLTNLIINARDAMPESGSLTYETKNVFLNKSTTGEGSFRKPGRYVKLSVIDTGTGIPPDLQQKVFEPFFTTKDVGEGVGLGLATVYGIVKNHDGYVDLFSEVGKGTRISIYLPVTDNLEDEEEEYIPGPIIKGHGETILIVDDDENVREIAQLQVQELGYDVISAQSGEEAVSMYQERHETIALVLLDVLMPGMDGLETYIKLKEINPGIKAVVMSGFSKKGRASELLNRGAEDFIQKPFQITDLSKTISDVIT